jgi:hypothetical protein
MQDVLGTHNFGWRSTICFEIDDEVTVEDKEELVVVVVLVPVILPRRTPRRMTDSTDRAPLYHLSVSLHQRRYVDDGEGWELDVEVRRVGVVFAFAHGSLRGLPASFHIQTLRALKKTTASTLGHNGIG